MADIKIREVSRGNIKTLDRASSYMHHIKEARIRTKELGVFEEPKDDPNNYAQNTIDNYAGDNAVYAAKESAELIFRSKDSRDRGISHSSEAAERTVPRRQETTSAMRGKEEYSRRAFREQSIKSIQSSRERSRAAGRDAFGKADKRTLGDRIINSRRNSNLRLIQKRQKEYAIAKLRKENAKSGGFWRARFRGINTANPSGRKRRAIRDLVEKSRALLTYLTAGGGAAVVVIIVIMLFFGAALSFTEDGHYIEGTGDNSIVEVARGEVGNVGGKKYWSWYGFKSRVDWCAIFCSWCADRCGYLEDGTLPKFALVGDGANWFKSRHRWSGRGYTPKPGDFIFFDYEQNGALNHVGIVESCDGKVITTIEGNSGDACKRNSYVKGSASIAGYGLSVNKSVASVEDSFWMMSDALLQKEFEACRIQSVWMKDARYGWEKHPTIEKSKKRGSCVTYVACVLQRMGYLSSGEYVWHSGSGYGTGKVRGTTEKMATIYMDNKPIRSIKSQLKPGDIVLLDDNRSGEGGSGGHIFIFTGEWSGDDPIIWDNETAWKGQKPRAYSGSRKVLAVVRLK